MNDFLLGALTLFLAVAPLGAVPSFHSLTRPNERARIAAVASATAFALLAAVSLLSDPFLDWLDVSPENFQLAAALLVLPHAAHLIWRGSSMTPPEGPLSPSLGWLMPLSIPLLVSPASAGAALSYAARIGEPETIGAGAIVLLLTGVVLSFSARVAEGTIGAAVSVVNRFSGALLVILALELAVDGIRSV